MVKESVLGKRLDFELYFNRGIESSPVEGGFEEQKRILTVYKRFINSQKDSELRGLEVSITGNYACGFVSVSDFFRNRGFMILSNPYTNHDRPQVRIQAPFEMAKVNNLDDLKNFIRKYDDNGKIKG